MAPMRNNGQHRHGAPIKKVNIACGRGGFGRKYVHAKKSITPRQTSEAIATGPYPYHSNYESILATGVDICYSDA